MKKFRFILGSVNVTLIALPILFWVKGASGFVTFLLALPGGICTLFSLISAIDDGSSSSSSGGYYKAPEPEVPKKMPIWDVIDYTPGYSNQYNNPEPKRKEESNDDRYLDGGDKYWSEA